MTGGRFLAVVVVVVVAIVATPVGEASERSVRAEFEPECWVEAEAEATLSSAASMFSMLIFTRFMGCW